ncbi:hypothetical protein HRI_004050300 [Hibiscus trionum]|uniref:Uncharacterized protein n=1 Tax=Hibiscus trionum TaxID=183268 RepID=A0A9W7IXP6_HIBTR|nr:hypothetical protein HRI_004050300 [Hibiscus trionum]
MLIITYTSSHNHLGPGLDTKNRTRSPPKEPETNDDQPAVSQAELEASEEEHFHYLQSLLRFHQNIVINQEDSFAGNIERRFMLDEEPLSSFPYVKASSTPKSDENDFFDDLEELPICSAFTSFMRSKVFGEGVPVVPS